MSRPGSAARRATIPPRAALRVLVVGGGVAALEATLALRALAEEKVSIELVAPEPQFWYRPLAVPEPFGLASVHGLDLAEIAHAAGASFTLGAIASVDADRRLARTAAGAEFEYDVVLLAPGAKPAPAVRGAFTFRGLADSDGFRRLLSELAAGSLRKLVFAVPGGVAWPLPIYELALLSAAFLGQHGIQGAELALVTPEETPLGLFGETASTAVGKVLAEAGVKIHTARRPIAFEEGTLALVPGESISADRVVALPRLRGQPIAGIPHDRDGFVPTDRSGRVRGLDDVFAAGDVTTFPVKQGGLAAQQARAAAEEIAATAGADVSPQPFRPVLRGLLLTGGVPAYLRSELAQGAGGASAADTEPLWWPPGKIVGRHLAPFLAERAGTILAPPAEDAIPVELDLTASLDLPRASGAVRRP